MGLLDQTFQMTLLGMNKMIQIIQVVLEAQRFWLTDAAQDLQARVKCIRIDS